MKLKKEYVALGVVIVALVLYLVLHKTNREQYQLPVLPEVAAKDINRIEIKQADEALREGIFTRLVFSHHRDM